LFGSGFILTLCSLVSSIVAHPRHLVKFPQAWARISIAALRLFCGIDVRIEGREYLPKGSAVIAAQHQSTLDILIWLTLLERPAFVFKRELRKIPIFGALLAPTGMIPVDRGGAGQALRRMVADCGTSLASGHQVVIFPEGTRVAPGKRVRLRPGIAALAMATTAPVIPAATDSGLRWGPRAFGKTPGTVSVKLSPPLEPGLSQEEILTHLATLFYEEDVTQEPA
jgi:1-acyl-sn-glycerol-3-phosphate acyltransferase